VAVVFSPGLCHNPGLPPPGARAAVAVAKCSISTLKRADTGRPGIFAMAGADKESQMPKIKTKSGAKKRFKITGTGKVLYAHRGKRHGMIKRTNKQIRQLRGTNVLFKTDGDNIKKYWLPNG
jgi:large subunit ribosomal protein L35